MQAVYCVWAWDTKNDKVYSECSCTNVLLVCKSTVVHVGGTQHPAEAIWQRLLRSIWLHQGNLLDLGKRQQTESRKFTIDIKQNKDFIDQSMKCLFRNDLTVQMAKML